MNAKKPNSKLNEIGLIVKSGITGALGLMGICIILIIVANTIRLPLIALLYEKTIAKCSLQGLFLAVGSFGFIFGLLVRRRLPVIQKGVAPMAIAAVPLIFGVWLLDSWVARVSVPKTIKLSDCTNSMIEIQLKAPKGHGYQFELLTPEAQTTTNGLIISSYKFSGRIRILKGTSVIADLPIVPDKVEFIESGFILAGADTQNNTVSLGQFLQPQKDYDIQITLDPRPPPSS
jgi:hypothetical protein